MKRCNSLLAAVLVAVSTLSVRALSVRAETYGVDPVHSSAIFRIKHNNTSFIYGRITAPEGTIVFDAARPEASSFDITLKSANINTDNAQRDQHLKSADFFNAKEFPTLAFKSKSVKKGEGDSLEVTGDLTIHGVTKAVTVTLDHTGDGQGTTGFEGTFNIKRSDYGMTGMIPAAGDDVRIIVSFEAKKK